MSKFEDTIQKMFTDQFNGDVEIDFFDYDKLDDGTYRYYINIPDWYTRNEIEKRLNRIQASFDRFRGKGFYEGNLCQESDYVYLLDITFKK